MQNLREIFGANCELNETQIAELEDQRTFLEDKNTMDIVDAMTDSNYDWIFKECEEAIKTIDGLNSIGSGAILWVLPMTLPIKAYRGQESFYVALVKCLHEDKRMNFFVYERLNLFMAILGDCYPFSFDKIRAGIKSINGL